MKRSRDQVKAELLAELEAIIDELLERSEEGQVPTLAELEEAISELRDRLGHRVAEIRRINEEAAGPVPGPLCSRCGQEMRYQGTKAVAMESPAGVVELERPYYYCPGCQRGVSLPASATGAAQDTGE